MSRLTAADIAGIRAQFMKEQRAQQGLLDAGTFFTGYADIWEKDAVLARDTKGKFTEICRASGYSNTVEVYHDLLVRSESQSEQQRTPDEAAVPCGLPLPRAPSPRTMSKADSKGSGGPQQKKKGKKKGKKPPDYSVKDDSLSDISFSSHRGSWSPRRSQSSSLSHASNRSQSSIPDFAGRIGSTRAHMIPNREKGQRKVPQICYKYYNVVCQPVLGFFSQDSQRLERIAFEMADSAYNFLRSPSNHGPYLDVNPCWILVPACSLEFIKTWTPGTPYPVLAVANKAGDITTAEAYKQLCQGGYNIVSAKTPNVFQRSKCTKPQLKEATDNLRSMVLAMAETLVGRSGEVKPYQDLLDKKNKRGFITRPENRDQWIKKHYDAELFENTIHSIKNMGIQVPKLQSGLQEDEDLNGIELLVFDLNPNEVDLYPDPMLLLMKAAINWSWYCDQKLLPACGGLKMDDNVEEEEEDVEVNVPSTPVPTCIECRPMPVPVTPDDDNVEEEEEDVQVNVPSTPVLTCIERRPMPVPVTPD